MDIEKRNRLVGRLSREPEPALVPIDEFFDGNDDLGSIGCNLIDHPGIETFRAVLGALGRRSDVSAVYAQVAEVDPGEDSWPFADAVIVVGSLSVDELKRALDELQPDDVGLADFSELPPGVAEGDALFAWWD